MKPKNLGKLLDRDLAGFKLVRGYFLELNHGLMGMFPAVFVKTKDVVVCLDKNLLEKIWNILPRRKAKVTGMLLLVNTSGRYGINVQNYNAEKTEPLHILFEDEFQSRVESNKNPFEWAPGLISFTDESGAESPFSK